MNATSSGLKRAAGQRVLPWEPKVLAGEARHLAARGGRRLLGIAGPPGSGKSTLAVQIYERLRPLAVVVGMDGFHLANKVLAELGLAGRKGAPETFDAAGFRSLLARLRAGTDEVVYAPEFHRDIDEPIAGAVPVDRSVPLVIVEGNYLLLDDEPWFGIRRFFDQIWYVDVDGRTRRARLVGRHVEFGKTPAEARAFVLESDERNAAVVEATAQHADLVVRSPPA